MQVRESSGLRDADSPQLLGLVIEDSTESGEGDGLGSMAVASHDGGGHRQRIEDRLLSCFNRCRDERVHMGIGQLDQWVGSVFRIMRDDVRGGESAPREAENSLTCISLSCLAILSRLSYVWRIK